MYCGAAAIILLIRGLFWLVLFVGVGFLVAAAWRSWSTVPQVSTRGTGEGALAILAARYARGEIGREEYLQMRKDLAGTPGGEG